jgi:hypothetical protein
MQFSGCEFFNGFRWSSNVQELKYLVSRQGEKPGKHLLESQEYLSRFYSQSPECLAGAFKVAHGERDPE